MAHHRRQLALNASRLFGMTWVCYVVVLAVHELGHVIGVWLTGGGIAYVKLNPATWNWTVYRDAPSPLIAAASGVIIGGALCLLPVVIAALARGFARLPAVAHVLAILALGVNGLYLVGGSAGGVGDGIDLVRLGVPYLVVVPAGLVLVAASAAWLLAAQPRLGIAYDADAAARAALILGGTAPWFVLMFLYDLIAHGASRLGWFALFAVAYAVFVILAVVLASVDAERLTKRFGSREVERASVRDALAYAACGLAIAALEVSACGW